MSLIYTMRYRIAELINPASVVGRIPPERMANTKGADEAVAKRAGGASASRAVKRQVRRDERPTPARHRHEHQHNPPDEQAVIDAVIRHTVAGDMQWHWLTGRHLQAVYKGRVMHYNSKEISLEIIVPGERNITVAIPSDRTKQFHDTVMSLGDQREQQVRSDVYRHFTG